jgi:hypothetical protein
VLWGPPPYPPSTGTSYLVFPVSPEDTLEQIEPKLNQIVAEVATKHGLEETSNRDGLEIHETEFSDIHALNPPHMLLNINCGKNPVQIYLREHPAKRPSPEHLRLMRELVERLTQNGFRVVETDM